LSRRTACASPIAVSAITAAPLTASQALRNMAVVGHLPWLRAEVAKTLAELDAR
jgi:predicted alpha/beta hydrolase